MRSSADTCGVRSSVRVVLGGKRSGDAMRVAIRVDEEGVREWNMIELQGKLDVVGSDERCDPDGKELRDKAAGGLAGTTLGELAWVPPGERPVLMIGSHRLEGEMKRLERPLLVLRRYRRCDQQEDATEWHVVGYTARVWHFGTRPRPVVTAEACQRAPRGKLGLHPFALKKAQVNEK
eukprot:ctg_148.g120